MSYRTTKKAVMAQNRHVIELGYCDLYHLLNHLDKAHTEGVRGWNADVYDVDAHTAIVTGYRPFGNIRPPREVVKRYEDKAERLYNGYYYHCNIKYSEYLDALDALLAEFAAECIGEVA